MNLSVIFCLFTALFIFIHNVNSVPVKDDLSALIKNDKTFVMADLLEDIRIFMDESLPQRDDEFDLVTPIIVQEIRDYFTYFMDRGKDVEYLAEYLIEQANAGDGFRDFVYVIAPLIDADVDENKQSQLNNTTENSESDQSDQSSDFFFSLLIFIKK